MRKANIVPILMLLSRCIYLGLDEEKLSLAISNFVTLVKVSDSEVTRTVELIARDVVRGLRDGHKALDTPSGLLNSSCRLLCGIAEASPSTFTCLGADVAVVLPALLTHEAVSYEMIFVSNCAI